MPGHRRQSSAPIQNQLSSDSTGLPDDDTFVKQSETDSVPLPANNHNHRSSSAPITGSEELNKLKDFVVKSLMFVLLSISFIGHIYPGYVREFAKEEAG